MEIKEDVYLYIACSSLLTIGVIGNGLIIGYFVKINKKKLQKMTTYHFLLTYLAFVDIVVSIGVPLSYFNRENWWSNEFVCKYSNLFLGMTLPSYSVYILVMVSYERYRKMVYPFKTPIKKKILSIFLFFLIVAGIGFYFPLMNAHEMENNECLSLTTLLQSKIIITVYFVGGIFYDCLIPSAIMVWFYFKISANIKEFHNTSKTLDQNHKQTNAKQDLQIYARKRVALKTLRTLIIMCILFITPGRIFSAAVMLIVVKAPSFYRQHYIAFSKAYNLMEISVYLNNMGNVFVYAWLIVGFRGFLKRAFIFALLKRKYSLTVKNGSIYRTIV